VPGPGTSEADTEVRMRISKADDDYFSVVQSEDLLGT
jgi:hypothetical protein